MRHHHLIDGPSLRLRPLAADDAEWVVALRSDPALGRWLHAGAADADAQRRWIAAYEQRAGDWCFVVERRAAGADGGEGGDVRVGMVGVYGVDATDGSAEWGRWVLQPGSLAAVESAWLVYRFAFETLALRTLVCRTVADNAAVVSFHDSCGITDRRLLPRAIALHGREVDLVEHRVDLAAWPALDARLGALAQRMARRLRPLPA